MSELLYHVNMKKGDVGKYCILPGDPGRCAAIASYFDGGQFVASNREYVTYAGTLDGEPVCVTSTGIGGPSAAIALEELVQLGVQTFIRVGTSGGIHMDVKSGDICIATASVRQEGTSREYAPIEYPAAADFTVVRALADAAQAMGCTYHVGVVQSKDSFYGQHSPDRMPVAAALHFKWEAWKRLGVLCSEMEGAALFTAAAALGVRCGACFSVVWNQERRDAGIVDPDNHDTDAAVRLGVEALRRLIRQDREKAPR